MRPSASEYGEYFDRYISLVREMTLCGGIGNGLANCLNFWKSISEEQSNYRYAAGKWSIKELVQHLIDTERIFCYRALSIARGENDNLAGYDHDAYAFEF